jgi:hypothetical protein
MIEPVDFLGQVIKTGNLICYPVRRGSEMYLRKLRLHTIQIIQTVQGPIFKLIGTNDAGRQVSVEKCKRTIVIKE